MTDCDVLFVHNNFPAQFRHLALRMQALGTVRVRAIAARTAPGLPDIDVQRYGFAARELAAGHAFARRFELECRRAEQVIYTASAMKHEGFSPKLIYVHPGWGESLPLRALFPDATICVYAEYYYRPRGVDVGFDPEFPQFGVDGETRVTLRNAATLLALADADFAIAPTHWQRSVFPVEFQPKIHIVHDGIDFARLAEADAPGPIAIGGQTFAPDDEIVTFVSRSLEPYRGFHIFMRALPQILDARPNARICIVGADGISYGARPSEHATWREAMMAELGGRLDLDRVHFMGTLPYAAYLSLLRRSRAHVYLTYPFVLSWSLLEAMALECPIIASDTLPVREVVEHGVNGLLVPFFEPEVLARTVVDALRDPAMMRGLRACARRTVEERYDFDTVSWPAHLDLIARYAPAPALVAALRGGS